MSIAPFSLPGSFRRGNLHTHSTISDGALPLEQVCSVYREAGYDFLAVTDHFMEQYWYKIADTTSLRTEAFTTIIGAELHTGKTELGHLWHILAVGLPLDFAPNLPNETGPEIAARALRAGAFVAAPHPAWYGLTEADVVSLGDIHAIEVYNATSCDYNDRPDSVYMLDLMLMRGRRYSSCATDDAHFKDERYDALRGWVQVKSEHNEPQALVDALKAGSYYSSTGPKIHDIRIGSGGDTISVYCSPAERVFLTGYGSKALQVHGHGIHHAEFSLKAFKSSPYVRVTVRDCRGGRAWSNAIWLE
jgi:hypothetical protein